MLSPIAARATVQRGSTVSSGWTWTTSGKTTFARSSFCWRRVITSWYFDFLRPSLSPSRKCSNHYLTKSSTGRQKRPPLEQQDDVIAIGKVTRAKRLAAHTSFRMVHRSAAHSAACVDSMHCWRLSAGFNPLKKKYRGDT